MIPVIFEKLKDNSLRSDAALALLIGADTDTVMRMIATYNDVDLIAPVERYTAFAPAARRACASARATSAALTLSSLQSCQP